MTANIEINPNFNLPLIAERAGNGDVQARLYRAGRLYVDGVTQEALDAALAGYDHTQDAPAPEPSELETLKEALKSKGVLADADLQAARVTKRAEMKAKLESEAVKR